MAAGPRWPTEPTDGLRAAGRRHDHPQMVPDQSAALDKIGRWLKERDKQVFQLFGYAGTGKSTMVGG